jgi:hypothetical protein
LPAAYLINAFIVPKIPFYMAYVEYRIEFPKELHDFKGETERHHTLKIFKMASEIA